MDPVTLTLAKSYTDANLVAGDGIPLSQKGAAGGVAALNASGQLASAQVPLGELIAVDTLKGTGNLHGSATLSGQTWTSVSTQLERTASGVQQTAGGIVNHYIDVGVTSFLYQIDVWERTVGRQVFVLKYVDESNFIYAVRLGSNMAVNTVIGGTDTNVLSVSALGTNAFPAGGFRRSGVRAYTSGSAITINLLLEGQLGGTVTVTNATLATATRLGIRHENTAGVCYRNLSVRGIA